jgi:hypothetical protein
VSVTLRQPWVHRRDQGSGQRRRHRAQATGAGLRAVRIVRAHTGPDQRRSGLGAGARQGNRRAPREAGTAVTQLPPAVARPAAHIHHPPSAEHAGHTAPSEPRSAPLTK